MDKENQKLEGEGEKAEVPEGDERGEEHLDNPEENELNEEENELREEDATSDPPKPKVAPERFKKYLAKHNINVVFQIIFAELAAKRLPKEKAIGYATHRIKQIGNDLSLIHNKKF